MKTIGLIGGVSWFSTAEYYRRINLRVQHAFGPLRSARTLVYSFDFNDILPAQKTDETGTELRLLFEAASKLEHAGAEVILICSNTTNKQTTLLQNMLGIPIINIVEATCRRLAREGRLRVGLLGTKTVMRHSFYREEARKHGIEITVPTENEQDIVHNVIYDELCNGIASKHSRMELLRIIERLGKQGVDGVILGCTELPLLIKPQHSRIPVIDSIESHIDALFDQFPLGVEADVLCVNEN